MGGGEIVVRIVALLKSAVLLLAAQHSVIELSSEDKAFIAASLDGHALKA